MKSVLIIMSFFMTFIVYADECKTSSEIIKSEPGQYIDGRPYPSFSLYAEDEGVIIRHGDGPFGYDALGARDVAVYRNHDEYYLTYDGAGPDGWLVNMATSKDLKDWKKLGPMLQLGNKGKLDSASASFGTLYYDGSYWHMYYLATVNASDAPNFVPEPAYTPAKAISVTPTGPWVKEYNKVPFTTAANTFYSMSAAPGPVYKSPNGGFDMMFSSGDETNKRTIGIAHAETLNSEWKVDPKPVLPTSEQIENPSLYYQPSDGMWFMFVNHVGIDSVIGEYTDAVWVYWTKDYNNWQPENRAVVLDSSNVHWTKKIIGLPSVIKVGNRLAIFYDGQSVAPVKGAGWTQYHMKRDIGISWLNLPIETPK